MSLKTPSDTNPSEVSEAKLAANRANAQQSTGPRTEEGKARSSRNAVKHGLFSRAPAEAAPLTEQERADLDALVLDGRQRYQPRGAEEEAGADRIATLWFELQRGCAGRERYWRERLAAGDSAEDATRRCAAQFARERQLERSIRHARQDFVFLQRHRNGELCKHKREELQAHDRLMQMLTDEQDRANFRLMDSPRAGQQTPPPAPSPHAGRGGGDPTGVRPSAPPQPPMDPAIIPHAAKALALLAQAGIPVHDAAPAPQAARPQAPPARPAYAVPPMARVPVRLPPFPAPAAGKGRKPNAPLGSDD